MSVDKDDIPLILRIRAAIATALGATAAHAKLLADQEEREIEHLLAIMIETQVNHSLNYTLLLVCGSKLETSS